MHVEFSHYYGSSLFPLLYTPACEPMGTRIILAGTQASGMTLEIDLI